MATNSFTDRIFDFIFDHINKTRCICFCGNPTKLYSEHISFRERRYLNVCQNDICNRFTIMYYKLTCTGIITHFINKGAFNEIYKVVLRLAEEVSIEHQREVESIIRKTMFKINTTKKNKVVASLVDYAVVSTSYEDILKKRLIFPPHIMIKIADTWTTVELKIYDKWIHNIGSIYIKRISMR